ncbi:hypothetical protein PILCRDRAFT_830570, partial [Piloderma croceum F 1598]
VMGQAGAGKSSFINTVTGSNLRVADHIPCTKKVESASATYWDDESRKVVLVDTPAFDIDLDSKEVEKLKKNIEAWKKSNARNNVMNGIIYLHKISEPRMTEPPCRRLETFEKLCGSNLPEKVILVTSMWNMVTEDEGSNRERQLQSKYWLSTNRSNMTRYGEKGDVEGARRVVDMLLAGGLS